AAPTPPALPATSAAAGLPGVVAGASSSAPASGSGSAPPSIGGGAPAATAATAAAGMPSPLDTLRPGTAPNVAAATRLADSARLRLAAGDDAAALEQLERAIAIDPNNAYAYYYLAQLHLRTRSYDQAIALADRAASLSAGSPGWASRAWVLQGTAYEAAGRFADARQAYMRAVQAAPGNATAAAGLVR